VHLAANGDALGPAGGTPICTAAGVQLLPSVVSAPGCGALVTWTDQRDTHAEIYVARFDLATQVTDVAPERRPAATRLHAGPNPFRAATRIEIEASNVSADVPSVAEVFDVAGRRVRRLLPNASGSGARVFIWDGRTDAGRQAAPGTYFVRVRGSASASELKIVRTR
jgi:hypothetical protein